MRVDHPQLTIGLPVHNGEDYLEPALESLLAQSYSDFELIVRDNGSTDSTPDVCQAYARRDRRVVYQRNECNIGAAANFNLVVDLARSPYFAWANHDDLWAPTYFERCLSLLASQPSAVLAYSHSMLINESGEEIVPLLRDLGFDAPRPHQRLRQFHRRYKAIKSRRQRRKIRGVEGLWVPIYGVIRTPILKATGKIGAYVASDTVLLEELLMRGAFLELDQQLFFKRDHPDRSVRKCHSFESRNEWFTGAKPSRLFFPRFRWLRERLAALRRSELRPPDRMLCYAELLAFYLSGSESLTLCRELGTNAGRIFTPHLQTPQVSRPGHGSVTTQGAA
jgi:glycosyltransferase involved in cell wall biosynthesis